MCVILGIPVGCQDFQLSSHQFSISLRPKEVWSSMKSITEGPNLSHLNSRSRTEYRICNSIEAKPS